MLEDQLADAELNEHALKKGGLSFESRQVQTKPALLDALHRFQPDLMLANPELPGFEGLQVLMTVRELLPDLPVLFVTQSVGTEKAVQLMHQGANDLILKDHLPDLPKAVLQALDKTEHMQEMRDNQEHLRWYERIIDNTHDMMSIMDCNYTYRIVNEACAKKHNRPKSAMIGHGVAEVLGQEVFHEIIKPNLDRCLNGEDVQFQNAFDLADGLRYLDVRLTPYYEANGRQSGAVVSCRDVTFMYKAEILLELQAKRSEALLRLSQIDDDMDEAEYMRQGLELTENLTGSPIAFIYSVNEDQQTIELIICSHRTLNNDCQRLFDKRYTLKDAGIWTHALGQKKAVVVNDYARYAHKQGLPAGDALLHRMIALPVIENDKVVMLVGVGNKTDDYSELDVESVKLIANEIWRIAQRRRSSNRLALVSRLLARSLNEIYIFDSKTLRFIEVNQGASKNLGYSMHELECMTPPDLATEYTHEAYQALLNPLREGNKRKIVFTTRHRRKNGSTYPVESHLQLIDENPPVFLSMIMDISEREQIEAERLKLAQAVEQSPESIVITNLEAEIEYVNQAFLHISGYSRQEVIGQNPRFLKSGQTNPETYIEMWDALTRGRPWQGELWNRKKDGSEFIEMAHIAPIKSPAGDITHYLAVKEDITEKKRLAEELDAHRQHLEALVESRTSELVTARYEAERLAQVKSEFLANMSHEIRTPLNAILGFSQIGMRDNIGRKARETFARILESSQLLQGIVDEILDYSKMEAGKLTIEKGSIRLRALVDNSLDLVRHKLEDKGLTMQVRLAADLPASCSGDSLRLSQVLMNLLSNAVKFTENGGVTLSASRDRDQLVLQVEDTGIGMAPDQVKRLFEPFEQADGSITRKYGGTGLGLTITKRLIEMMDGSIEVASKPGQGSSFMVRVPLLDARGLASEDMDKGMAESMPKQRERLAGLSILVAEDNEINRLMLEDMLSAEGCRLEQVENGEEAVERVRQMGSVLDLVLMDIQMPVMDGYQATREIRQLVPDLPVIGLTAHALAEEKEKCLAAGMVEHVAKPVVLESLLKAILRHRRPDNAVVDDTADIALTKHPLPPRSLVDLINWPELERQYEDRQAFLVRLLSTMLQSCAAKPARLRELMALGDFVELSREAHSLKGMASAVMPDSLRQLAVLTEQQARQEDEQAKSSALQLAAGVEELMKEIRSHLPSMETAAGADIESSVEKEELESIIKELLELLAQDDTLAIERHSKYRYQLRTALGAQAEQLSRQIEGFDFENAMTTLQQLTTSHARIARHEDSSL
jgi:PAS domain S-box-containing protein